PLERSATTYVLPELRDVTLVWTFTLPNPVTRHCGIASAKLRSSSADGLSWTVRASTFNGLLLRQGSSRALARSERPYPTQRARPHRRCAGRRGRGGSPGPRNGERPMDLSEDELIKAVARLLSGSEPGVVVGLGDDAAVVEPGAGQLVLTTDLLAEGVHFERGSISARDLGATAITVNGAGVPAMAASPRYALVAIAAPGDVDAAWVVELVGGMREACAEYALALVGGDTNRGGLIVVSVAVGGGGAPGRAGLRCGGR